MYFIRLRPFSYVPNLLSAVMMTFSKCTPVVSGHETSFLFCFVLFNIMLIYTDYF